MRTIKKRKKYSMKNRGRRVQDRLKRDTQRHKVARFLIFLKEKKSLGSGYKVRVVRVTRNKHFLFWPDGQ